MDANWHPHSSYTYTSKITYILAAGSAGGGASTGTNDRSEETDDAARSEVTSVPSVTPDASAAGTYSQCPSAAADGRCQAEFLGPLWQSCLVGCVSLARGA